MSLAINPRIDELTESERNALDRLRAAKGFAFDMDGVLYRGNAPLPGVSDLLNALVVRNVPYSLATNNSTLTPASYVDKLAGMGVAVTEESILTSGLATKAFLKEQLPEHAGIFVIGAPALREVLFSGDSFRPVQFGEEVPAAVVVGLDREFNYEKLFAANAAIRAGAMFIATNADVTLPTEHGLVPGCGSIVAAIAAASEKQPVMIGKPEATILHMSAIQMGVPSPEVVMVGDRLDTDIVAAERAGMLSVMVLTGVSTREDLASANVMPDLVFTDLPALMDAYIGYA